MSRKPRIEEPDRRQGAIRFEIPEDALPIEHPARVLWDVMGKLELSAFVRGARAVEGKVGRPTKSPRMLLTLWCYAISRGIGSAREIERLTQTDLAFRWITAEKSISRQTLSKFRVRHGAALEKLFTDVVGLLMSKDLLQLETVAIDGMRVRAHASAPSFRRRPALEEMREQAALHLKAVLAQADDPTLSWAVKAAREQGARDFQQRIEDALDELQKLEAQKKPPKTPRASTTDAEARVMKMADGGFRPGLNVQFTTAGDPMGGRRTIVAANVTNSGSDMRALLPMIEQVAARAGQLPTRVLADANHANFAHIEALEEKGVDVFVPPSKRTTVRSDRPDRALSPPLQRWMDRMETPEAKRIYRARASLCELSNAMARARYGMQQFLVRGTAKATCVVLLTAITHNLLTHAPHLLG